MRIEKLDEPYVIASQHPIVHWTCFITSLILYFSVGAHEQLDGSRSPIVQQLFLSFYNNIVNICLQLVIDFIHDRSYRSYGKDNAYNCSYLAKILTLLKTVCNLGVMTYIQVVVLDQFNPKSSSYDRQTRSTIAMIWLLFQLYQVHEFTG